MIYRNIEIKGATQESCATEIMYEIAAGRADGIELIRFDLSEGRFSDPSDEKKVTSSILRLLKGMKEKGAIQLIATKDSFNVGTTEAVYLLNKYPDIISAEEINGDFIYVKI